MTIWTDAQFDSLSWHDNHVHALRIIEGPHGTGTLALDIDYILEWLPSEERKGYRFRICPAELRFLNVTDLRIRLDYATATAAVGPFSLAGISRREEARQHYTAQIWTLAINWPGGEISFAASGFEQVATGGPVVAEQQWLAAQQRVERR